MFGLKFFELSILQCHDKHKQKMCNTGFVYSFKYIFVLKSGVITFYLLGTSIFEGISKIHCGKSKTFNNVLIELNCYAHQNLI